MAAFATLDRLLVGRGVLPWSEIESGFVVSGFSVPIRFAGRATGIFKPKEMTSVLSVRTVMPRAGRKIWYKDQNQGRDAIFAGDTAIKYAFRGTDPAFRDNVLLRQAAENQTPLIYFVAIAPTIYSPLYPAFLTDWDPEHLEASIVFAMPKAKGESAAFPKSLIERRYRLTEVKQRIHQAEFREAVLDAYGGRCAITGLPVRDLLDASHIVPDGDEDWGQPVIPNGLPLTKVHHAAYDAKLIGIDADGVVHVSGRLMADCSDQILEKAVTAMKGLQIKSPKLAEDRPDRDRLAMRFEKYLAAN
jgi:putative restriction endonuclease